MNKFIFCLLLLPILLVGVCAVSASSDLDADVPVIGSEHPAFVGSESELPALEGHVASERPALEGHVASESVASESVDSESVGSESGLLAFVGSEHPALVGSEHPTFVASDLPAFVASESGLLALVSESIVGDLNMGVFLYFPFGPHLASATETSV